MTTLCCISVSSSWQHSKRTLRNCSLYKILYKDHLKEPDKFSLKKRKAKQRHNSSLPIYDGMYYRVEEMEKFSIARVGKAKLVRGSQKGERQSWNKEKFPEYKKY